MEFDDLNGDLIDQILVRAIGKLMNVHSKKTPEQIFQMLQEEVIAEEENPSS